jgi:hypothetical protein
MVCKIQRFPSQARGSISPPFHFETRASPILRPWRTSRCRIFSFRHRVPWLSPCNGSSQFSNLINIMYTVCGLRILLLYIQVEVTSEGRRCKVLMAEGTLLVLRCPNSAPIDRCVGGGSRGAHLFRHIFSLRTRKGFLSHWRIEVSCIDHKTLYLIIDLGKDKGIGEEKERN